jgi:hypothetical protein
VALLQFRLRFAVVVVLLVCNPFSLQNRGLRHLSLISPVVLLATPMALTLSVMDFHTLAFILLFNVFEKFSRITLKFFSASSSNNVHSAGEKLIPT